MARPERAEIRWLSPSESFKAGAPVYHDRRVGWICARRLRRGYAFSPLMDARAPVDRRWEPGRWVARALCAVFAMIGALPLLAAAALSSGPLTRWAERETARVLRQELGVSATYKVELRLLPLRLAIVDLTVPAADGGSPALVAETVTVAPRVFALFGGRLDLGEIEIKRPQVRLVVRDGKVMNVAYKLPEQKASTSK